MKLTKVMYYIMWSIAVNGMLKEYDEEGKDLDHQLNLILKTLKHDLPLNTYKFDIYEMVIKIMNKYDKLPDYDNYMYNYHTFLKETYYGVREKIKSMRELIISLLTNNNIKFDKICTYNNSEINFATIIVVMILQVYETNIYYLRKLNNMVYDIHNITELKLLVQSGILSIINFNAISLKESCSRMTCMSEMRTFISKYCCEYKNELNNILKITYDVTNIIYLYLI